MTGFGRPDRSRYVVMIRAHGANTVFNVYADADKANAEAKRLREIGFEAHVREGGTGSPDWVQRSIDATRRTRGPMR